VVSWPLVRFIRRPSAGVFLAFIAGVYLGIKSDFLPLYLLVVSTAALLVTCACIYLSRLSKSRLLAVVFHVMVYATVSLIACFSGILSSLDTKKTLAHKFSTLSGDRVSITGTINGDPDVIPATDSHKGMVQFSLRMDEIIDGTETISGDGVLIWIRCYGSIDSGLPAYGERWMVRAKIPEPTARFEGGRRSISSIFLRVNIRDIHFVSPGKGWWIAERCFAARQSSARYLSRGIKDYHDSVAVLRSLLLGYRWLPYEMRQVFIDTGTLHIFAISGSHVVVFAGIIIAVLGMFRVSSIYWGLFIGPLLCAYTFATGLQSSAMRACLMAVIYWCAPLVWRKPDGLNALFVSAIIIMAVSPMQIFDTGFILSFVCVFGLILLYPLINKPVQQLFGPDPLRLQPTPALLDLSRSAGSYLWSVLAMSIAAWLVSFPLTAFYFGNFTPVTLLSNLIVIPLSSLVILCGCLSLVLGACIEWFAEIFNHANLVLIWMMVKPMQYMAKLPFATFKIEAVPTAAIVCWYALLGLLVFRRKCREHASTECPLI